MKLHKSVVDKLLYLFQNYGGFSNDNKLRAMIEQLDLTPYERKTTASQEIVLVDTEDYVRELNKR